MGSDLNSRPLVQEWKVRAARGMNYNWAGRERSDYLDQVKECGHHRWELQSLDWDQDPVQAMDQDIEVYQDRDPCY